MKLLWVAGAIAALTATAACNSTTSDPSAAPPGVAKAIDYGEEGAVLGGPEDILNLGAAPEDFKQFIGGNINALRTSHGDNEECAPSITVVGYDPKGFGTGSINGCGGYAAIWQKKDGAWQEIIGSQMGWPCDELKEIGVPINIAGDECFDGEENVPYRP